MNNLDNKCMCQTENDIVLACSGASDLGYLSDQVARKLSRNKIRKMNCLVLTASCSVEKLEEFKKCDIMVIDGCAEDCGKKIVTQRGILDFKHLRLTDLGYEKGKTSPGQDTVNEIYIIAEKIF